MRLVWVVIPLILIGIVGMQESFASVNDPQLPVSTSDFLITDLSGNELNKIIPGQKILVEVKLTNQLDVAQDFVYYLTYENENGVKNIYPSWITGNLLTLQTFHVSLISEFPTSGEYTITIEIWNNLEEKSLISVPINQKITVMDDTNTPLPPIIDDPQTPITVSNFILIDTNKNKLDHVIPGQRVLFSIDVKNNYDQKQKFTYSLSLERDDGFKTNYSWFNDNLQPLQYLSITGVVSKIPKPGEYEATFTIWNNFDEKILLSTPMKYNITVEDNPNITNPETIDDPQLPITISYFKIIDLSKYEMKKIIFGEQPLIQVELTNKLDVAQAFVYNLTFEDEYGTKNQYPSTIGGTLPASFTFPVALAPKFPVPGEYTITIEIWNNLEEKLHIAPIISGSIVIESVPNVPVILKPTFIPDESLITETTKHTFANYVENNFQESFAEQFSEQISLDVDEYELYTINSTTMMPTLNLNDVVYVDPKIEFTDVTIGDIIVFHRPSDSDKIVVHRVMYIFDDDHDVIRTKGDANPTSIPGTDFPITEKVFLGKVVKVVDSESMSKSKPTCNVGTELVNGICKIVDTYEETSEETPFFENIFGFFKNLFN